MIISAPSRAGTGTGGLHFTGVVCRVEDGDRDEDGEGEGEGEGER